MERCVLFVNTPTIVGGAEISLLTLMQHLEAGRYSPRLLASGDGPFLQRALKTGIPVSTQNFPWFSRRRPWQYVFSICRLVRTIRDRRIALVHTNCDHSLRYVMRASRLARVPYVSHVRDFTRTWFEPDKLVALNRAARVIANSEAVARSCIRAGVEPSRVVTIYNPVDVAAFQAVSPAPRVQLRGDLSIPGHSLVVSIVGFIQPIKGHGEFVQAAIRLADRFSDMHFLVVGSPPDESCELFVKDLKTRVLESGHTDRFHFTGFRDDIHVIMKATDILAVPSWTEPFGRVAVEGLIAGCAVVGTTAGGLPEIITDGVDGLLVAPKDTDSLYAALYRLAIDPGLRQRLSELGSQAAQRFTISKHVEQVQALYDAVLSSD